MSGLNKIAGDHPEVFGGISLVFRDVVGHGVVQYKFDKPLDSEVEAGVIRIWTEGGREVQCKDGVFRPEDYLYEDGDLKRPTQAGRKYMGIFAKWIMKDSWEVFGVLAQEYISTFYKVETRGINGDAYEVFTLREGK